MHTYATDTKDRESIPVLLAVLAVAFALLLNSVVQKLNWQIPWWVDAPSVMGFYGILYYWFDNFFWLKKFKSISLSAIPDLRGTWVGMIVSDYKDGTTVDGVIIHICQTWLKISVQLETETSRSHSIMAAVNTYESSQSSLKYEYMSEPSALSVNTMEAHRGIANLRLAPNKKELKGDYFAGRGRRNIGTMEFKLISRDYLNREEALKQYKSFK